MRCTVCGRDYPTKAYFQPPVRTCLPCYASRPCNHDLREALWQAEKDPAIAQRAWDELRRRAARSRYSRIRRTSNLAVGTGIDPGDQIVQVASKASTHSLDLGSSAQRCDGCGLLTENLADLDQMPSEEKALICRKCAEDVMVLDKRCSLCQKVFPLASMHMFEAKPHCVDCVKRKYQPPVAAILDRMKEKKHDSPT